MTDASPIRVAFRTCAGNVAVILQSSGVRAAMDAAAAYERDHGWGRHHLVLEALRLNRRPRR